MIEKSNKIDNERQSISAKASLTRKKLNFQQQQQQQQLNELSIQSPVLKTPTRRLSMSNQNETPDTSQRELKSLLNSIRSKPKSNVHLSAIKNKGLSSTKKQTEWKPEDFVTIEKRKPNESKEIKATRISKVAESSDEDQIEEVYIEQNENVENLIENVTLNKSKNKKLIVNNDDIEDAEELIINKSKLSKKNRSKIESSSDDEIDNKDSNIAKQVDSIIQTDDINDDSLIIDREELIQSLREHNTSKDVLNETRKTSKSSSILINRSRLNKSNNLERITEELPTKLNNENQLSQSIKEQSVSKSLLNGSRRTSRLTSNQSRLNKSKNSERMDERQTKEENDNQDFLTNREESAQTTVDDVFNESRKTPKSTYLNRSRLDKSNNLEKIVEELPSKNKTLKSNSEILIVKGGSKQLNDQTKLDPQPTTKSVLPTPDMSDLSDLDRDTLQQSNINHQQQQQNEVSYRRDSSIFAVPTLTDFTKKRKLSPTKDKIKKIRNSNDGLVTTLDTCKSDNEDINNDENELLSTQKSIFLKKISNKNKTSNTTASQDETIPSNKAESKKNDKTKNKSKQKEPRPQEATHDETPVVAIKRKNRNKNKKQTPQSSPTRHQEPVQHVNPYEFPAKTDNNSKANKTKKKKDTKSQTESSEEIKPKQKSRSRAKQAVSPQASSPVPQKKKVSRKFKAPKTPIFEPVAQQEEEPEDSGVRRSKRTKVVRKENMKPVYKVEKIVDFTGKEVKVKTLAGYIEKNQDLNQFRQNLADEIKKKSKKKQETKAQKQRKKVSKRSDADTSEEHHESVLIEAPVAIESQPPDEQVEEINEAKETQPKSPVQYSQQIQEPENEAEPVSEAEFEREPQSSSRKKSNTKVKTADINNNSRHDKEDTLDYLLNNESFEHSNGYLSDSDTNDSIINGKRLIVKFRSKRDKYDYTKIYDGIYASRLNSNEGIYRMDSKAVSVLSEHDTNIAYFVQDGYVSVKLRNKKYLLSYSDKIDIPKCKLR